ncbi:F-box domain protein [Apiospora marii]|uniref:F-box domain protein n=1 Tax=Apiospora marii TaxID=335849 RepID=A0ABR1SN26_9PEZI
MVPQLPPEIWCLVFGQLSSEVSQAKRRKLEDRIHRRFIGKFREFDAGSGARKALANLGKVSRRFAALAQPELFRTYEPVNRRLSKTSPPRFGFLETVLARPNLAACVREIHLGDVSDDFRPAHHRRLFLQMAAALGLDPVLLQPVYEHSSAECLPMLAVLLTPNLELLSVRLQELPDAMDILERIEATGAAKPLERVRDLTLQSRDDKLNPFELRRFFPLLALTPKITTLRLVNCNLTWDLDTQPNQEQRLRRYLPRGLQTLEIWHSCMQHESMGILLAHLSSLETFVYRSREYWSSATAGANARSREVTAKQLMRHLLPSQDTLRDIEMSWDRPYEEVWGGGFRVRDGGGRRLCGVLVPVGRHGLPRLRLGYCAD